jgi:hypothetical protein
MITPYSNIISVTTLQVPLLLDTYSGAAAAYSLRLLSNTYSGDAIRVRRASDNTEQDIGFVDNELDTSALTTFCSGTDGFVETWYDQSGNGRNATQGAAANQPQIVSSGSVILDNGKPSVQFDGIDDSFSIASTISTTTSYTMIEVNKRTNTSANSVGIANTGQPYVHLFLSTTLYFSSVRSGNGFFATYPLDSTNQQLLFSIDDKTNNLTTFLNQTLIINGLNSFGSTSSSSFNNIGNRSGFTKDNKQELIFYPSDQSSNRTGIETNINDFYSIY